VSGNDDLKFGGERHGVHVILGGEGQCVLRYINLSGNRHTIKPLTYVRCEESIGVVPVLSNMLPTDLVDCCRASCGARMRLRTMYRRLLPTRAGSRGSVSHDYRVVSTNVRASRQRRRQGRVFFRKATI
jgi:hypothetical protein